MGPLHAPVQKRDLPIFLVPSPETLDAGAVQRRVAGGGCARGLRGAAGGPYPGVRPRRAPDGQPAPSGAPTVQCEVPINRYIWLAPRSVLPTAGSTLRSRGIILGAPTVLTSRDCHSDFGFEAAASGMSLFRFVAGASALQSAYFHSTHDRLPSQFYSLIASPITSQSTAV